MSDQTVSIKLPPATVLALKGLAERDGTSIPMLMRNMVTEAVARRVANLAAKREGFAKPGVVVNAAAAAGGVVMRRADD